MTLKVAVQMDPIERINIRGDSTFALLLEAQRRKPALSYYTPEKPPTRDGQGCAPRRPPTGAGEGGASPRGRPGGRGGGRERDRTDPGKQMAAMISHDVSPL